MSNENSTLIQVQNLCKTYGDDGVKTAALCGANFEIGKGEFVAIMGPSGSGKSTLMQLLGLLDKPTNGKYFFEGKDTTAFDDDTLANFRNKKIGFVFQAFNLLSKTSATENVELPLIYSKVPANERKRRAIEALKEVGLGDRLNHTPNQLSGGQQQRVAIARALVTNPSLILADEPTGNLDSKSSMEIIELLRDINKKGNTVVIVTHEHDIASEAKRIVEIKDGKVVSDK